MAFVMNPQSHGEVTLTSTNPADPPAIDPRLLSHPFDRRVAIEGYRQMVKLLESPVFAKNTVRMVGCAKSDSDEDIWVRLFRRCSPRQIIADEYVLQEHYSTNTFSSWHMCGTAKMGRTDEENTCVDTSFRILGVHKLRVVDLSVTPFVPK